FRRVLFRSRSLLRPPLPVPRRVLRGGGACARGRRRPRDREPRALLRAPRLGRRRAARARRGRLRRGAPPGGVGGVVARRAREPRGTAPPRARRGTRVPRGAAPAAGPRARPAR